MAISYTFNPFTGNFDAINDENVDAGTADGQLLFWDNATGEWTHTEISEFVWDDTNKRLGIGTTTPSTPLHVVGAETLAYSATEYVTITPNDKGVLTMTNTTAGAVTTSNYLTLERTGDVYNTIFLDNTNTASGLNAWSGVNTRADSNQMILGTFGDSFDGGASYGNLFPYIAGRSAMVGFSGGLNVSAASDIRFNTNILTGENEAMRITTAGNVGIGTTSPDFKLTVNAGADANGGLRINGSNNPRVFVYNTTYGTFASWQALSNVISLSSSGPFEFRVNNSSTVLRMETTTDAQFYRNLKIGRSNISGIDLSLTFETQVSSGSLQWMENENYFKFNETLKTAGGRIKNVTTVTDTYTVLVTDDTVVGNKATDFTITLPTAVVGQVFTIKNIGVGTITVDGAGADTIDGETTQDVYQWSAIKIQCNAANEWIII